MKLTRFLYLLLVIISAATAHAQIIFDKPKPQTANPTPQRKAALPHKALQPKVAKDTKLKTVNEKKPTAVIKSAIKCNFIAADLDMKFGEVVKKGNGKCDTAHYNEKGEFLSSSYFTYSHISPTSRIQKSGDNSYSTEIQQVFRNGTWIDIQETVRVRRQTSITKYNSTKGYSGPFERTAYDSTGKVVSIETVDSKGNGQTVSPLDNRIIGYRKANEKGKPVEEFRSSTSGASRVKSSYYDDGHLKEQVFTFYDKDGKVRTSARSSYSSDNNEENTITYGPDGKEKRTRHRISSNGKPMSEITHDDWGHAIYDTRTDYKRQYDEQGKIIEEVMIYDSETTQKSTGKKEKKHTETSSIFTYNEFGHVIKFLRISNSVPEQLEEWEYTYWPHK